MSDINNNPHSAASNLSPKRFFVAVDSYGYEKVTDPTTGLRVSALKCTRAVPQLLLTLFGENACDLTPPRALAYRYIHLSALPRLHKNFLVLSLTAEEVGQVEALCRTQVFSWVYLWREGEWFEFPGRDDANYRPAKGRGSGVPYPRFSPPQAPFCTPSRLATIEKTGVASPQSQAGRVVLEKSGDWWWLTGNTYPHRALLKSAGARWSKKRQAWYLIGATLPASLAPLVTAPKPGESETVTTVATPVALHSGLSEGTSSTNSHAPEKHTEAPYTDRPKAPSPSLAPQVDPPAIRIVKPDMASTSDGDVIGQAILAAKPSAPVPSPAPRAPRFPTSRRTVQHIGQRYVGELTGSISGEVHCYGFAVHDGVCVYVNMAGPRLAVEAIRAKLGKGEAVNLVSWDGPSLELTAGEGQTGKYTDFFSHLPEARFTSLILVHEWLTRPNYGGKATTFLIRTSELQAMAKLKQHVTELVSLPVFDAWTDYLWQAGQSALLVRKTLSGGDVDMLSLDLDSDAWSRLITGGLVQGAIQLPV